MKKIALFGSTATVRNLELINPLNEGGKTLVGVIDRTLTPMGARMLRRWVVSVKKCAGH
ncbi:MAG TPA: hypothetical protein PLF35_04875 [Prolixibacteraceae bacterium]|nr:hypothetical protein [Prolixibacteraceae bacterium]